MTNTPNATTTASPVTETAPDVAVGQWWISRDGIIRRIEQVNDEYRATARTLHGMNIDTFDTEFIRRYWTPVPHLLEEPVGSIVWANGERHHRLTQGTRGTANWHVESTGPRPWRLWSDLAKAPDLAVEYTPRERS